MKEQEKDLLDEKEKNSELQEESKEIESNEEDDLELLSSVVDDFSDEEESNQERLFKSVEHIVSEKPSEKIERKAQKFLEKQKDFGKYEPVRTQYPLFLQLPNACGLSSILMLLDPIQNEQIGKLLDDIWEHFKKTTVIEQKHKEFQWAYALDYLLLKSAVPNPISDYIKALSVEELDHYYVGLESVLRFHQQDHYKMKNNLIVNAYEEFFVNGLVSQWVISQHIDNFKHNPEIRILMAVFGYEFVKQPSPDGTGALFFTDLELKNPDTPSTKKKINILRSEFIKGARIMVGFSFHWVILTNIYTSKGEIHVSINDPAGKKYNVAFRNLTERDRFYIYRKMKAKPKKLWDQIRKLLEEEGPLEVKLAEEIMDIIKDRIEMKIEKESDDTIRIKIRENPEGKTTPISDYLEPILRVHDDTVDSLKREKKEKIMSSTKKETEIEEKEIEEDTSSKSAFMKKMRKIIGENFQDYNEK